MNENSPSTDPPLLPAAGPWARCLARILDIWVSLSVPAFVFGLFVGFYWGGFPTWMSGSLGANLIGLLLLPFALVIDAGLRKVFGNTPGKALLGISVIRADGRPLGHGEYLGRNFKLWIRGLGLGIPIVSLITMILQYQRLAAGRPAGYDELGRYHVVADAPGAGRKLAFSGLFALFLISGVATLLLDELGLGQNDGVIHGPLVWTNHQTGVRVNVDAQWSYRRALNADGQVVERFEAIDGRSIMIVAGEMLAQETLDGYWASFVAATADVMRFHEHATVTMAGRPVLRAVGTLLDEADSLLIIHVIADRAEPHVYWRIVTLQYPPHHRSESQISDLRERMLASWF